MKKTWQENNLKNSPVEIKINSFYIFNDIIKNIYFILQNNKVKPLVC